MYFYETVICKLFYFVYQSYVYFPNVIQCFAADEPLVADIRL